MTTDTYHGVDNDVNFKYLHDQYILWQKIVGHIESVGQMIMDSNEHNRYVRQVLLKNITSWWYSKIVNLEERRIIHYAYAVCCIGQDLYSSLAQKLPELMVIDDWATRKMIDLQKDMFRDVLNELEKDLKIALAYL